MINLLPKKESNFEKAKRLIGYPRHLDWDKIAMWAYFIGTVIFVVSILVYGFVIRPQRLNERCQNKYGQNYKGALSWNQYSVDLCVGERGDLRIP